jgi:hypothetical protein
MKPRTLGGVAQRDEHDPLPVAGDPRCSILAPTSALTADVVLTSCSRVAM